MGFNKIAIWLLLVAVPFLAAKPRYERGDRDDSSSAADTGIIRDYFMQIEPVLWDYLPNGNQVDNDNTFIDDMLTPGPFRIGNKWKKYLYKRYTDNTFTVEIPSPPYHGLIGPLLRGECGDTLHIHLRNLAHMNASCHPHGMHYDKAHEGALYNDGTSGYAKGDEGIPPYGERCLIWTLPEEFCPLEDDPNCMFMAYHGHRFAMKDVDTGLLGGCAVCKKGVLNEAGERTDGVKKEVVILMDTFNEGESWRFEENMNNCQNPSNCWALFDSGDPDFAESLLKDQMNGFMFGSMPGLEICQHEIVQWYIFSLEAEIHPFHLSGHTLNHNNNRRVATDPIFSATFKTATTVSAHLGTWLLSCMNSEHNSNGMRNTMKVIDCNYTAPTEPLTCNTTNTVKLYWQAENCTWNYGRSGLNLFDGGSLTAAGSDSAVYFNHSTTRVGGTYMKSMYVPYTNANFTEKINRSAEEEHLGFLGPVVKVEEGECLEVTLRNNVAHNISLYMQCVMMDKANDGTYMKDAFNSQDMIGKIVAPGETKTYYYTVPKSVVPLKKDPKCKICAYYSHFDLDRDVYSGLIGAVQVCKKDSLKTRSDGTRHQRKVDKEFYLFFSSTDENLSWHADANLQQFAPLADPNDPDYQESNVMRAINGHAYGNLPGLEMCLGDRVRWHVFSFGAGEGLHTPTWMGHSTDIEDIYRNSHVSISTQSFVANMPVKDNPGEWAIICHNHDHFNWGMKATYTVKPCGSTPAPFVGSGKTRTYYIACVERDWDYSPSCIHPVTNQSYCDPNSDFYGLVRNDGNFIGSSYKKALYREFDASFTIEKPHPESLGTLGPFIHAEMGDVIEVVFKNNCTRNYSMHALNMGYDKVNEGFSYLGADAGVAPGSTFTYHWKVKKMSAPKKWPRCTCSPYHSAVDMKKDIHSGLSGSLVICKPGSLHPNNTRIDGWKEFSIMYFIYNEMESHYWAENSNNLHPSQYTDLFIESNVYYAMNGRVMANLKGLVMNEGDTTAWYSMAMGNSDDMHTGHWHGQMLKHRSGYWTLLDVIEMFPATCETAIMKIINPGTWLLHCHVGPHATNGMVTVYTVYPAIEGEDEDE